MFRFPSNTTGVSPSLSLYCLAAVVFLAGVSNADARKLHRRYHRVQRIAVAAQPFSFGAPSRTRLAYYYPRTIHRTDPADRDDEGDRDSFSKTDNRDPHPTTPGKRAVLRHGIAYAPASAPESVKSAIWAANQIRRKPYVWGGGHGSFNDNGYDCSGTVSYALHHAGLLGAPIASNDFLRYGDRGRGRWITVYARHGHTFAVIAGLRLDTTDFRYGGDVGPRWHNDGRNTRGFDARHPVGL